MKKIGIIMDSSCGLDEKEIKARGWYLLPLYIEINGKEYKSGVDLTNKDFYKKIKLADKIKTGSTSPAIAKKVIEKALKENEKVIIYTLSKTLSGQNNLIKTFVNSLKNKNIYVVDSIAATRAMVSDAEIFEKKCQNMTIEEIKKTVDEIALENAAIVMPKKLDWLKKGGRVSGTTAAFGNLLNIVPVIGYSKETKGKLEKLDKGRTFIKTCVKMGIKHIISKKNNFNYFVFYGNNESEADEVIKQLSIKTGIPKENFNKNLLSPVISSHCGPNSIVIARSYKNE